MAVVAPAAAAVAAAAAETSVPLSGAGCAAPSHGGGATENQTDLVDSKEVPCRNPTPGGIVAEIQNPGSDLKIVWQRIVVAKFGGVYWGVLGVFV